MQEELLMKTQDKTTFVIIFSSWLGCFLTIVFLLCPISFFAQSPTDLSGYYFRTGLDGSYVRSIMQDNQGFVWVGTNDGLFQYDGYQFKKYRHDPNDSTTISNNQIRALYEDKTGRIWVGTYGGGINILNQDRTSFTHFFSNPDDANSLSFDEIMFIYEDTHERLWVGTDGGGLNQYLLKEHKFLHYEHQQADPHSLSHNNILSIGEDHNGYLWVGTWMGLNRLDPATGKCIRYNHNNADTTTLSSNYVWWANEMQPGKIWITPPPLGIDILDAVTGKVKRNGLPLVADEYVQLLKKQNDHQVWIGTNSQVRLLNPETGEVKNYDANPLNAENSTVTGLMSSSEGLVWIGLQNGLAKIDANDKQFNFLSFFSEENEENPIYTIYQDSTSVFWLGTQRGLVQYDPATGQQQLFPLPNRQYVRSFCAAQQGYFWVGTDAGLFRFYPENGKFQPFAADEFQTVSGRVITEIFQDRQGVVWAGTILGLNKITFQEGKPIVKRYENEPNNPFSLVYSHHTSVVFHDREGNIWVGTNGGGISRFDPQTEKFNKFLYDPDDPESISNNFVECIYEDRDGHLWVGTQAGLNKLDRKTGKFHRFTTGLDNYWISSIVGDNQGILWLSTPAGITRFNPKNETFIQFDKDDGLISSEFISKSDLRSKNGTLYFGTTQGLISFHPDSIHQNPIVPPIVITNFSLFNELVLPGENSPLQKTISLTDSIELSYQQSSFSFEYVALNYTNSKKNQYSYKLEGFDEHWNNVGGDRKATYTNVGPGEYTFHVKGSNNDGVWNNEGASVHITVLPPFWQTKWAYLIYFALTGLSLYGLYFYLTYKAEKKNQLALEQLQVKQAHELNQLKIRFFTNISHEIRTPLTLILSPLERMLQLKKENNISQQDKKQLDLVYRNAQRLQDLVNQLIDFRKLESGNLMLEPAFDNLSLFVKNVFESFTSLAEEREIDYQLEMANENIWASFDADKLEKILGNLLSNAFKFTHKGGKILVSFAPIYEENMPNKAIITIEDTGVGITENELPHIFDPFYQGGNPNPHKQASSGIGLALTKELVNLHLGEIKVESKFHEGTKFTLALPLEQQQAVQQWENITNSIKNGNEDAASSKAEKPMVLIVDDNEDIRNFIQENLEDHYEIQQAPNGKAAIKKISEIIPDLIISDIMMPGMDGITLCKKLKSEERTNHIPVLLLTASGSETNRLKGLMTGADDYMEKPFNIFVLKARLQNLYTSRQRLREKYSKEITLEPTNTLVNSAEANLLDEIIGIVEKHMEDTDFNVTVLCRELGISRPQLYRKLQSLTGQSVNEFVRTIRLKRAAQLLKQGNLKIAEVAYHVGFNDPQYFSKCFKKQFGISPTKMAEELDI